MTAILIGKCFNKRYKLSIPGKKGKLTLLKEAKKIFTRKK